MQRELRAPGASGPGYGRSWLIFDRIPEAGDPDRVRGLDCRRIYRCPPGSSEFHRVCPGG